MEKYARTGTLYEVGLYNLGEAIVRDAFRVASHAYLKTNTSKEEDKEIKQSLAFIGGTGLNVLIKTYGLNLDPDTLRVTFTRCIQKIHLSVSSSAIT